MLLNAALWAPALARVLDQSLRYTVDKTTREILFLPLPAELKLQAKPFVDVTVDRVGKGIGALLLLVLDPALGPEPRLAAAQLRQPGHGRACGSSMAFARQARIPRGLPPASSSSEPSSRPICGWRRPTCRRSKRWSPSWRTRTRARGLRDRRPRVARQAQPGDAAAALPRVADGPRARARRARRGRRKSRSGGCRQIRRMLERPDRRGAAPRRSRRWQRSARGRGRARAAASRRSRSAHRAHGGGRARRAAARTWDRRGGAGALSRLDVAIRETAAGGATRVARWPDRRPAVPAPPDPAALRLRPEVAEEAMESGDGAGCIRFLFVPTLVSLLRHRR